MINDKQNVLVLGAGVYQVPGIEIAKEMGYRAIVLSYNINDYPGSKIADISLNVDTTDILKVLEIARTYNIMGVFTTGTDVALPALGKVNDELGLCGPSYESCLFSSDKVRMKKAFKSNDVPTARFEVVHTFEDAIKAAELIGYPVMVKATQSSGSRGITKVVSVGEMQGAWEYAKRFSKADEDVLVEEYLCGDEFGAQAFIHNGDVKLVCPHNDTTTAPPRCVPIGHSYPYANNELADEIEDVVRRGVSALKMNNCAANVDLINTKDGIKVLEIGSRMGATCLPLLTEIYTGVNVTRECLKMALGLEPDFSVKKVQPTAGLLLTPPKSGILCEMTVPEEVENDPYLVYFSADVTKGDVVNAFTVGPDRIGEIVVIGDDWSMCEEKAKDLSKKIRVVLENDN